MKKKLVREPIFGLVVEKEFAKFMVAFEIEFKKQTLQRKRKQHE